MVCDRSRRSQLDPARMTADQRRRPDTEQGHQRDHDDGVQGHEARILNVAACEDRAPLSRPYSLANPCRDDERHEKGSGELGPAC